MSTAFAILLAVFVVGSLLRVPLALTMLAAISTNETLLGFLSLFMIAMSSRVSMASNFQKTDEWVSDGVAIDRAMAVVGR